MDSGSDPEMLNQTTPCKPEEAQVALVKARETLVWIDKK